MAERTRWRQHPWTPDQVGLLLREWGVLAARALLHRLKPHTWVAIRRKAEVLGLPRGIPQGHASIAALARKCGVAGVTLAGILEGAGVVIRYTYPGRTLPSYQRRHSQRRYAETDEALAAFERWLDRGNRTETRIEAAARLGGRDALYHRAQRAGLCGGRRVLRLLHAQWDALAALPPTASHEQAVAALQAVAP